MAPSAKRITTVLESSNKFNNDERLRYAIAPLERPTTGVIPPTETDKKPEKKKGISKRNKIIAAAAAVAVAVGAGAYAISNQGEKPAETPTSNSGPQNPGEEVPVTPEEPNTGELLPSEMDLEIPAGLSDEELAEVTVERLVSWSNAASDNEEIHSDWVSFEGETVDYATSVSQDNATYFTESLFVDGWESNENLAFVANANTNINSLALYLNLVTSNPENGDIEPYRIKEDIQSVNTLNKDETGRTLEIITLSSNNSDQNRALELASGSVETSPYETYLKITYVTVNGKEKIADWLYSR